MPFLRMIGAIFALPVCSHVILMDNFFCFYHFVNMMGNRSKDYPDVYTDVIVARWRRSRGKDDVEFANHDDEKGKEKEALEKDEEERGRL